MSVFVTFLFVLIGLIAVLAIITRINGARAAAAVPATGKFTATRNARIHWTEAGDGPPVVMIHGLGGNLRHFTYALTDELKSGFRCIAVDRPGNGWSERDGPEQATLPEQARIIADFIVAEGLGRPLIVGHSLGGAIAETIALNHPEVVGGLALICPATAEIDDTPDAFRGLDIPAPALIPVLGHTVAGSLGALLERAIFRQVFAPEPICADFATRGGALLNRRAQMFISTAQDLSQARASVSEVVGREAELKRLDAPVGVLFGAADEILDPVVHGERFAEISGASYDRIPGKGHMIPLTAPRACADFIRSIAARMS